MSPLGRVLEIAEEGRRLSKRRGFLVVGAGREEAGRVPLDDLTAVLVTAPGTEVSVALLAALAERGVPFLVPGANHAPVALLWPLAGHHAASARMAAQIARTRGMEKRLWQRIVAQKIRAQGWALARAGAPAGAFARLAREVKPGDPDNLEAQAARRYWPLMMGEGFRRDVGAAGANALLNYGYAVLRAAVARAICAAGLHPGLGVFHRNPQNPMPLADDLMEPFRPFVDETVRALLAEGEQEVSVAAKRRLVGVLWRDTPTAAGRSPLATAILRSAQSLAESYLSGVPALDFPLLEPGSRADDDAERLSHHVDDRDVRPAGDDEGPAPGGDEVPPMASG
ncbi:type II CRISPR-associated endonuclease Cas1 [Rubritepida flocculans]|uniref:type II CRISPR-associated endonuclease Cas1 n=1 Tax=Rubritepida flocculans TaxID=182403 RepID=UPI00041FBC50|nr:type II CRISPR-associated endonuclease Cas1 [Rubritepida flocculans]